MTAILERRFSKAKANANHVVWTEREFIPAAFHSSSLIYDGLEFAILRIAGRDMFCGGFRVDFQQPASALDVTLDLGLATGDDMAVGETLRLIGTRSGGDRFFTAPLPMPAGSIWKARASVLSGEAIYLPQGATLTYFLRFASGPLLPVAFTPNLNEDGIGFWEIGKNFQVQ